MMLAAVLYAKDDIRAEPVPVPEIGEQDVLVKVAAAGICGSDIPRVLGDDAHHYPLVLGHEFAGVVEAVGADAANVRPGDRVAGIPLVPCRRCRDCQRGNYAQCRQYSFIGSRVNGGFAQYVKLPAANVWPLAGGVRLEEAALLEPATVALHALRRSGFRGGEDVAVLGGGNIGLLALQWARLLGARSVTVFDIDAARLEAARSFGADAVVDTRGRDAEERSRDLTDGRGFGIVLETAGAVAAVRLAFAVAGNGAAVCLVGTPGREVTFSPKLWEQANRKEFTLTGSWMSYSAPFPGIEWEMATHFLETGALNLRDAVFRRLPLADAAAAFALYRTPGAVGGKILLLP